MTEVQFAYLTLTSQGIDKAVDSVIFNVRGDKEGKKAFHLVNSYTCQIFANMRQDNPLLERSSVNFPDGFWISQYLRKKSRSNEFFQIRGPELFEKILATKDCASFRQLFLGSTEETLDALKKSLTSSISPETNQDNLFFISPPFRAMTQHEITQVSDFVRENEIDLIWVGMGTPKQDYLANEITFRSQTTSVAVGAAFDFIAGTKAEAPRWMGKIGLEWLFRFATEPKRLWKRYIFGNLQFLWIVLKDLRNS